MLTRLIIRNFVLINELTLEFSPGYTAITGETGSGKSILLNALGLIKGERADFSVIGPSDTRSIVEAHFSVTPEIIQWLNDRSLEPWKEVILRREIHKDGKSRAFINDTPVTLQDMKALGERLFIIHSQYNTLELKNQEYQLYILDALSGTMSISESPMLQDLSSLAKTIERHEAKANSLQEIKTIVNEITARFSELSYLSGKALQQLESSEVDEATILSQVDEFNRILNKHRLTSQEALLDLQHGLEGRVSELDELKAFIAAEQHALSQLEKALTDRALVLNKLRKEALPNIEDRIQNGLIGLKLSGAQLSFNLTETTELNARGMITLEMLFSANKGMLPVPIQKAASGGELSRVMLLLQQLISEKLEMPSILFDEIDTGVSGDVAEKIGKLLKEMGQGRQLFAITHLPQVAAQALHHLVVWKTEINQRIETSVVVLGHKERITEIARLMSGEKINEAALVNARTLLNSNEV